VFTSTSTLLKAGSEPVPGIRLIAPVIGQRNPAPPKVIRARLKLSQSAFAGLMGVSLRTVQDWEQGRRKPSGPAVALLRIAEQKPDVFMKLS